MNGFRVDVGGQSHAWLQKNKVNIQHISEYAIHKHSPIDEKTTWLEAVLNGTIIILFHTITKTRRLQTFIVMKLVGKQLMQYFLTSLLIFKNT